METSSTGESEWYTDAFGPWYPALYAHRTVEAAAPEAAFAAKCLQLTATDHLLDLACGKGRHLVHLLRHAPDGVGLDFSPALLAIARARIVPEASLIRGDMRSLPFASRFTALTSFFTSFGYFEDEAQNEQVLREIARILQPGGRFFIDHASKAYIAAHLVPESRRTVDDYAITETRWIEGVRVNKRTRIEESGTIVSELRESVRLYDPDEFETLLARSGLVVEATYGDYTGALLAENLPRMILTGHKP